MLRQDTRNKPDRWRIIDHAPARLDKGTTAADAVLAAEKDLAIQEAAVRFKRTPELGLGLFPGSKERCRLDDPGVLTVPQAFSRPKITVTVITIGTAWPLSIVA